MRGRGGLPALSPTSPHTPVVFCRWLFAASALCVFATQAFAHGAYHDLLIAIDSELAAHPESADRWFRRAEINLGHREWMLAMLDLNKVEALAPAKFPTRWLKGQALAQGGKFAPAKTELDAFILTNPKHAGALASRGRVLRKLGKSSAALDDFREALLIHPDVDPELVIEIADAMMDADAAEEAAALLSSSLKRHGDDTAVLLKALEVDQQAKHWENALQRVESLQKTAPRPEPWMAKRAAILTLAGRPSDARAAWLALKDHLASLPNLERGSPAMIQLMKEADTALADLPVITGGDFGEELELTDFHLAEKPDDAALWYLRSTLAIRHTDWPRAISDAKKAELLAPGEFATRAVIARAFAETGKREDALDLLESEITRQPTQPEARLVRARLHAASGENDLAVIDYRMVIENQTSPGPALYLEVIDCLRSSEFLSEASALAGTSIAKFGNDPSLLAKALEIDIARRDFDAALLRVGGLEKISPQPESWMCERARILATAGRTADARTAWSAVRDRIAAMPNLDRGKPELSVIAKEAERHLAGGAATPVSSPTE